MVETLDQVADDDDGLADLARSVPAHLGLTHGDLPVLVQGSGNPGGPEGPHRRSQEPAEGVVPPGGHAGGRHGDLEELLIGVEVDDPAAHHAPEDGKTGLPAGVEVGFLPAAVVAEADIGP
jgi:hypothetical protein